VFPTVNKFTGHNGLTVLQADNPNSRAFCLGIWINSGSRDEKAGEEGLSHFMEHMLFKGTAERTALQLSREIERVGGSLDAFTTKEHICLYTQVLENHAELAFDVVGDMLSNPSFAPDQIELEKQVVLEEIRDVMDAPDDLIHDLFASAVFNSHPLGRPILGTIRSVSSFNHAKLLRYTRRIFRASNIVVSVYGNITRRQLRKLCDRNFRFPDGWVKPRAVRPRRFVPVRKFYRRRLHHQHFCLGSRACSYLEASRYPMMILTTFLGGGMSSRLFQRIREERGLAYNIFTYAEYARDTGLVGTYLSVKPKNAARAIRSILEEFDRIRHGEVTKKEIDDVKEYLRGKILLGLETSAAKMMRQARNEIYYGRQASEREIIQQINRVTMDDLAEIAAGVLDPANTSLVSMGPTAAGVRISRV
jgi:predicted Zn-dependent peptidase